MPQYMTLKLLRRWSLLRLWQKWVPETKIRVIMFLGSKVRRVSRADNIIAICGPMSRQCRIFNITQLYRPPRPVTGIALLFFFYFSDFLTTTNIFFCHCQSCNQRNLLWTCLRIDAICTRICKKGGKEIQSEVNDERKQKFSENRQSDIYNRTKYTEVRAVCFNPLNVLQRHELGLTYLLNKWRQYI
jgi:hypothetical protein